MSNYRKIVAGIVMVACLWVAEATGGQVQLDAEVIAKGVIELMGLLAIWGLRNKPGGLI